MCERALNALELFLKRCENPYFPHNTKGVRDYSIEILHLLVYRNGFNQDILNSLRHISQNSKRYFNEDDSNAIQKRAKELEDKIIELIAKHGVFEHHGETFVNYQIGDWLKTTALHPYAPSGIIQLYYHFKHDTLGMQGFVDFLKKVCKDNREAHDCLNKIKDPSRDQYNSVMFIASKDFRKGKMTIKEYAILEDFNQLLTQALNLNRTQNRREDHRESVSFRSQNYH